MLRAGQRVLLVDDSTKSSCSRVAAGLMNPIGGKRLKLIWNADLLIPHAKNYYQQLARAFDKKFFYPLPIRREFANPQEAKTWEARKHDPAHQRWVSSSADDHFTIPNGGYLDTNDLLNALHTDFDLKNCHLSSTFNYEELQLSAGGVSFRKHQARFAIFAEGHLATKNPHFQFVPYKPAKGIIASITLSEKGRTKVSNTHVLIRNKFIIPRHDGMIQIGATYKWNDPIDIPDDAGIQELEQFLDNQIGAGEWKFETLKAGVRPATAGAYPVVGPHPTDSRLIAFNGFGSKGSIQIPFFAATLADYLKTVSAPPLPSETLPSRFIKKDRSKPKRWIATNVAKNEVLKHLKTGDIAIDATAGNGHDTLWLANAIAPSGLVFAFDIQEHALNSTRQRLVKNEMLSLVNLHHTGHENLLQILPSEHHGQVAAIVFNLGFLPGGDPTLITKSDSTTQALKASLTVLKPGGILSVTLYPCHSGAQEEVDLVLSWFHQIDAKQFDSRIEHHPQGNPTSPYPLFVFKK